MSNVELHPDNPWYKQRKGHAIEFADWLHNNWFKPVGSDHLWALDKGEPEYIGSDVRASFPELGNDEIFTIEELYDFFINRKGVR